MRFLQDEYVSNYLWLELIILLTWLNSISILEKSNKCRRFHNEQRKKNYFQISTETDSREKEDLTARSIRKKTYSSKEINVKGAQVEETSRVSEKSIAIKI